MLDQQEKISQGKQEFLADVLAGLSKKEKSIPCKYFYDERGSRLFEQICEVDEYYLTNCELQIMQKHGHEIAQNLPDHSTLVEFGSGSSLKTRFLLDNLSDSVVYVPVDVSATHLQESVAKLRETYPRLKIDPVVGDFTRPIQFPPSVRPDSPVTIYFPGSTIGNFSPAAASELLKIIVHEIGDLGGLILGIDLQKAPEILEAAYNDKQGVTADFNLNLLQRINNELEGTFQLDQFEHRSVYNSALDRIETYLVSLSEQRAAVAGEEFGFTEGEEIHTEYSYKYTIADFTEFASRFGLKLQQSWTDGLEYFAVLHLVMD